MSEDPRPWTEHPADTSDARAALAVRDVTVTFGSLVALDHVDLDIPAGRIHVIVGQNGAGKSTLARVMAGLQTVTTGSLHVAGSRVETGDAHAARVLGVDMVHQHSSLVPTMTVAEALEVTDGLQTTLARYRRRQLEDKWRERLAARGVTIDVTQRVGQLSVEAVQSLEIARAEPPPGGILILDEPTAVLPPPSIGLLFEHLRVLVERRITVVVVLHKLDEVRALADTVAVLRNGSLVLPTTPVAAVSDRDLAAMIIGSSMSDVAARPRPNRTEAQAPALSLDRIRHPGSSTEVALEEVSLDVMPGEKLGVAGVEGNGQRGLVEIVAGVRRPASGSIRLFDDDVTAVDVSGRRRRGLRAVPFNRLTEGVSPTSPLWLNVGAWDAERCRRFARVPIVGVKALKAQAAAQMSGFDVKYSSVTQEAGQLSGGNIQRLVLAREFDGARAVVVAQPTRGLDIGGIRFVWDSIDRLSSEGAPILVVSSDLDELLEHCDRIAVIRGGRIVAVHSRPFSTEEIGAAMVGSAT